MAHCVIILELFIIIYIPISLLMICLFIGVLSFSLGNIVLSGKMSQLYALFFTLHISRTSIFQFKSYFLLHLSLLTSFHVFWCLDRLLVFISCRFHVLLLRFSCRLTFLSLFILLSSYLYLWFFNYCRFRSLTLYVLLFLYSSHFCSLSFPF